MTADLWITLSVWVIPIVMAVVLHEVAHGFAAYKLGDDTAKRTGRLSLNPIKHVDPFGTVVLPFMLVIAQTGIGVATPFIFGYAKPVPVDFRRLNNPRRDMVLVALAGPVINIVLAFACALLLHAPSLIADAAIQEWVFLNIQNAIIINVALAVFNMMPIPPLDGGRVMIGLLPAKYARSFMKLERYGFFVVLFLLFGLPYLGEKLGYAINPLVSVLEFFILNILDIIGWMTFWS